jgi:ABC-2 type transport system permease protein
MDARTDAAAITSRHYGPVNWVGLKTLIDREITRFIKVGAQTVFAPMINTVLLMMIVVVLVGDTIWPGTDRPSVDGVAAGLVMMSILSNAFQNASSSIVIAKIQGNAVDFLMPPLSALELTIAFILGAVARGMLVGVASLVAVAPFADIMPTHIWAVLYYSLIASIIFGAIGLMGGIWSDKFDNIAAVTIFVVTPLTMLSGTFFSTDQLPEPIRSISHYNPVFFLIDGFRHGFIGSHDAHLLTGAAVSGGLALALSWACWAMIKSGYRLRS